MTAQKQVYDFKVRTAAGKKVSMKQWKGKTLLIVNTASECGLTPQYKELEALFQKYKDKGFMVLAFPCNQFGGQEPGGDSTIVSFCQLNYGVSFPIMSKVEVNGKTATLLYQFLKRTAPTEQGEDIRWNFEKFLISRKGKVLQRFHPRKTPFEIETEIQQALSKSEE